MGEIVISPYIFIAAFGTVLFGSYNSILTSDMTVRLEPLPISSLEKIILHNYTLMALVGDFELFMGQGDASKDVIEYL